MGKIDIRGTAREIIINYCIADDKLKALEKEVARLKADAINVLVNAGHAVDSGKAVKSDKVVATIQQGNQAIEITYVETTRSGSIDWQAYAIALGGTKEGAESYRKPSITVPAIRHKDVKTTINK